MEFPFFSGQKVIATLRVAKPMQYHLSRLSTNPSHSHCLSSPEAQEGLPRVERAEEPPLQGFFTWANQTYLSGFQWTKGSSRGQPPSVLMANEPPKSPEPSTGTAHFSQHGAGYVRHAAQIPSRAPLSANLMRFGRMWTDSEVDGENPMRSLMCGKRIRYPDLVQAARMRL